MHECGPSCPTAAYLRRLVAARFWRLIPRSIPVKTWCRVCGVPVLLEVLNDYDQAVLMFHALDDTPMVHRGVHAETSGWGVNWRLDDVLNVLFLHEHEEELWPIPPWWSEQYGQPKSEDQGVLVMSTKSLEQYRSSYMDLEIRMLDRYINGTPREFDELEGSYDEVWSERDAAERFEIYGFKPPFALARCIATGERGTLLFQNSPRYYFNWDTGRVI